MTDVQPISAPHHERVLIVDYGSQVTQLIARRVREDGVFCEVHPCQKVDDAFVRDFAPAAVILSGGPESVTHDSSSRAPMRCSSRACRCWACATASS